MCSECGEWESKSGLGKQIDFTQAVLSWKSVRQPKVREISLDFILSATGGSECFRLSIVFRTRTQQNSKVGCHANAEECTLSNFRFLLLSVDFPYQWPWDGLYPYGPEKGIVGSVRKCMSYTYR